MYGYCKECGQRYGTDGSTNVTGQLLYDQPCDHVKDEHDRLVKKRMNARDNELKSDREAYERVRERESKDRKI